MRGKRTADGKPLYNLDFAFVIDSGVIIEVRKKDLDNYDHKKLYHSRLELVKAEIKELKKMIEKEEGDYKENIRRLNNLLNDDSMAAIKQDPSKIKVEKVGNIRIN